MPQFLLIVGALLVLLGMGSIAAGAPDWVLGLSLGATLIQSGTIALVGGLILIALGMVLFVMQDLLKRLDAVAPPAAARAPALAPPAVGRQPPAPEMPRQRETSPEPPAEELPRPPREPVSGDEPPRPRRERPRDPMPEEVRVRRPSAPQGVHPGEEQPRQRRENAAEEQPRQRREIAPPVPSPAENPDRPRGGRTLEQASEELARMRREYAAADRNGEPAQPRQVPPQPSGGEGRRRAPEPEATDTYQPKFRPVEPAPSPSNHAAADTVVRSGVIGGMAYTLYADGSIEAELPIGTVRFNSIAELQDHVTRTGQEADADFDDTQR